MGDNENQFSLRLSIYMTIGSQMMLVGSAGALSYVIYQFLVNLTGAKPSEYYSIQSRPGYRKYQQRVNMFIPGLSN